MMFPPVFVPSQLNFSMIVNLYMEICVNVENIIASEFTAGNIHILHQLKIIRSMYPKKGVFCSGQSCT